MLCLSRLGHRTENYISVEKTVKGWVNFARPNRVNLSVRQHQSEAGTRLYIPSICEPMVSRLRPPIQLNRQTLCFSCGPDVCQQVILLTLFFLGHRLANPPCLTLQNHYRSFIDQANSLTVEFLSCQVHTRHLLDFYSRCMYDICTKKETLRWFLLCGMI